MACRVSGKSRPFGNTRLLREVLDFLVTEEQLGVTFVTAAIERPAGTPSEAFVPVLRNAVTTEFHHVQALEKAGGHGLTNPTGSPTPRSVTSRDASTNIQAIRLHAVSALWSAISCPRKAHVQCKGADRRPCRGSRTTFAISG